METYHGHVRTPQDAIILFEACRLGVLPRVQRRLSEKERQQIKSGSVFVWDEREAGMRRWTDGKSWSASRVSGSFLTYREMEGKRGGNGFTPAQPIKKSRSQDGSRSGDGEPEPDSGEDGPEGYRYKQDGLMKQSFSITTNNGQHLHLISYYARLQPTASPLKQPSTDPTLRHIRPAKGMYPEATVNEASNVPAVTRGPMPGSPYAPAPQQLVAAPPYPHAIPIGFPPGYPPPGSWPASPVGPHYYYAGPPPHIHSPLHYPYHHPYGAPPPPSSAPGAYERPAHLPPPANAPQTAPGYPPASRPPLPSALSYTSKSLAPPSSTAESAPPHLPSPGPAPTNGHSLPPFQTNGGKPLTPPPSGSLADVRPQSSDASNGAGSASKVLPTIGALIHSDASVSAPPTSAGSGEQREANGTAIERSNSKSPAGPSGPQLRDLPSDKGSCRQDMMAIAALDGRFNKPTT